jgi:hypothetical protein
VSRPQSVDVVPVAALLGHSNYCPPEARIGPVRGFGNLGYTGWSAPGSPDLGQAWAS